MTRTSRWITCRGRVALELVGSVAAVGVLIVGVVAARAEEGDVYECGCSPGPRTVIDIFGGIECQHGEEQDVDCVIFSLTSDPNNPTPVSQFCSEKGVAAPNPLPTWGDLTPAQQNMLVGMGLAQNQSDGKCECFKCQSHNTMVQPEKCEGFMEVFGAYCEKDKEGNCNVEDDVEGTLRVDYPAELKQGVNLCQDSGNGSGDGSGLGLNEVHYCGGLMPGVHGGPPSGIGANCISDDCEPDLSQGTAIGGMRQKCK